MKPLSNLLPAALMARMHQNNRLTAHVRKYLASQGCGSVSVTGLVDGKLKLLADSAATATLLRYQQKQLMDHLNADPELHITHVSISVSSSMNR